MRKRSVLVAFIGVSGAGKTALCRALTGLSGRDGVSVDGLGASLAQRSAVDRVTFQLKRLPLALRELALRPPFLLRSAKMLSSHLNSRSAPQRCKVLLLWCWRSSTIWVASKRAGEIYILDQGPLQDITTYYRHERDRKRLLAEAAGRLGTDFPWPDLLVAVRVQGGTAERRLLSQRGSGAVKAFQDNGYPGLREGVADSIALVDETLEVAEQFGVPTLVVDNEDGDFEVNVQRLWGVLRAEQPGEFEYEPSREILTCPAHDWEFHVRTGQSWCAPERLRVRRYEVSVVAEGELEEAPGAPAPGMVKGPYRAETYPVSQEGAYLVVDVPAARDSRVADRAAPR